MKKKFVITLALMLGIASLAFADDAGQAVQGYGWRIVNFVIGIAAIVIAGNLAWCFTDMETHGRKARMLLFGLIGLGCIYGLVRTVANNADSSGTSVSGFSQAANMKP